MPCSIKEKKGDVKRYKGHADNGQIVKLVYVHEGYADNGEDKKRKELKNAAYFGGLYRGKDNEKLWKEVKEYIEKQYETEAIEKIYFQSDGGGWMKKGIEVLGAEFVLDEFHIQKYIRRMARLADGSTGEGREETEKKLQEWIEKGNRKKLEECILLASNSHNALRFHNPAGCSLLRAGQYIHTAYSGCGQTPVSPESGAFLYIQ